jgi:outer membrane murein-binding lipoprotein Lpp
MAIKLDDIVIKLDNLATKVNDLATKVNDLATKVNDLATKVDRIDTRLTSLEGTVKEIQDDVYREWNLPPSFVDGKLCAVCLEPLSTGILSRTPCWHVFHTECIDRVSQPTCPICRGDMDMTMKIRVHSEEDAQGPG